MLATPQKFFSSTPVVWSMKLVMLKAVALALASLPSVSSTCSANEVTIVMPSHTGHLTMVKRFLKSLHEFNTEPERTRLSIIVSASEVGGFEAALVDLSKARGRILSLHELLERYNAPLTDESKLLQQYGKVTLQSLKKLLGLLDASTRYGILLDSESYFIRPCPLLTRVMAADHVLYISPFSPENPQQEAAMRLAEGMLGGGGEQRSWVAQVITYQWVVQPEAVQRLWREELESGHKLFSQLEYFFMVEQLIYTYLMRLSAASAAEPQSVDACGSKPPQFINMRPSIPPDMPAEHFWGVANVHNNTHLALLSSLYSDHRFFTYTVKLHRKDAASAKETASISRANQKIVERIKAIELLTSTPLELHS